MTTVRSKQELELMAHLMRRAGFGATGDELSRYMELGYDATVDELLNPAGADVMPTDLIRRYLVDQSDLRNRTAGNAHWIYRMIKTQDPLQEKMTLFWHRVFATGATKTIQARVVINQLDKFRELGMGSFKDILLAVSRDPAMLMWLDNQDNHLGSINENFGREILELFSMGVGNYTEKDIKECARAFTGWTVVNPEYMAIKMNNNTARPYGYISWQFDIDDDDHDHGEKTFLGEVGDFNGDDIVDIICKQPATARFIARHLYHYFVADEVPVPQWPYTPPKDQQAIDSMTEAYFASDYSIGAMLETIFRSDYFKSDDARLARIKSPVEMVVGTLRMAGGIEMPSLETYAAGKVCAYMGQDLQNPPSVEGWMGGPDWINTGAYVQRINFASKVLGDTSKPGVRRMIEQVREAAGPSSLSAERLVDLCIELTGPMPVMEGSRQSLIDYAAKWGDLSFDSAESSAVAEKNIVAMLQLVVTTQEYQLA